MCMFYGIKFTQEILKEKYFYYYFHREREREREVIIFNKNTPKTKPTFSNSGLLIEIIYLV